MSKIQMRLVLEILGRPPENIVSALKTIIEKMSTEKGVKIIEQTIHDAVPVKEANDLYTSFAEVMLELESIEKYFYIIFSYMPANVELIAPSEVTLPNNALNIIANDIVMRLHHYDALAKHTLAERDQVLQKLYEVAPHLFRQAGQAQQQAPQEKSLEDTVGEKKEDKKEKKVEKKAKKESKKKKK